MFRCPGRAAVVLLGLLSMHTWAAEVTPFRLTGVDGHVELRYLDDAQSAGTVGGPTSEVIRTEFQQEFFVLTHSYFYHPDFLKVDFGGGPLFFQSDLEAPAGSASEDDVVYNLTAHLQFLESKPYPFRLFYDRAYPTVSLSLEDTFRNQNTKYGFNFQLQQPLSPVNLGLEATRNETEGEGFETIVNNTTDQATFRAYLPIKQTGFAQLTHNVTDTESASGSRGQPIVPAKILTNNTTFDSRVLLGEQGQFRLSNLITYIDQQETRPLRAFGFRPDLRWQHSDDMSSFYRFNFAESKQEEVQTTNMGGTIGFQRNFTKNLNISADVYAEDDETTGASLTSYGTGGLATYKKDFSFGALQLSAGLDYNHFDQQALDRVPVEDERHILAGITPDFLGHDFIVLDTIRVFRIFAGGSEQELVVGIGDVCTPGIEILVTAIEARTRILNCDGVAGQSIEVSVDYFFDPGGTVEYKNLVQNYQANLNFFRYYSTYVRFRDTDVTVIAGNPTQPLEESRRIETGASVEYPWRDVLTVGGEATYEDQEGTISSYVRQAYDAHVQFGLFAGTLRLAGRRVLIDYVESTEDVDLTRYSLQYRVRPWSRVIFTLDLSDEEDTGGSELRTSRRYSLTAEWRIRKLILSAIGNVNDDTLGPTERGRSVLRLTVRRDF